MQLEIVVFEEPETVYGVSFNYFVGKSVFGRTFRGWITEDVSLGNS